MHVFLLTVGDMFNPEDGETEPDWVTTEKKQFSEFRDMNKVCSRKGNLFGNAVLALLLWFIACLVLLGWFP